MPRLGNTRLVSPLERIIAGFAASAGRSSGSASDSAAGFASGSAFGFAAGSEGPPCPAAASSDRLLACSHIALAAAAAAAAFAFPSCSWYLRLPFRTLQQAIKEN